jgi:putative intracellular protease/amidase/YHS domain-containing protein
MSAMKRREMLKKLAAMSLLAAILFSTIGTISAGSGPAQAPRSSDGNKPAASASALKPPAKGNIPVAFLISDGAVVIDFTGPWEVFQDAGRFRLYTVAETAKPIQASGGMKIIPNYTFENAPAPKILVIPAQGGQSQATLNWIRRVSKSTDVTMSVCTGAFLLAKTGLLSGRSVTTHHASYKGMAMNYPDITVKRGARFVEDGNLASSGGLSSGIDLALRVVERYFGREAATTTAYNMEYQGQGWMNPDSNSVYAQTRTSTDEHPLCPICDMDVDPKSSPNSVYEGKSYYFCTEGHKKQFDAGPDKFTKATPK